METPRPNPPRLAELEGEVLRVDDELLERHAERWLRHELYLEHRSFEAYLRRELGRAIPPEDPWAIPSYVTGTKRWARWLEEVTGEEVYVALCRTCGERQVRPRHLPPLSCDSCGGNKLIMHLIAAALVACDACHHERRRWSCLHLP